MTVKCLREWKIGNGSLPKSTTKGTKVHEGKLYDAKPLVLLRVLCGSFFLICRRIEPLPGKSKEYQIKRKISIAAAHFCDIPTSQRLEGV